MNGIEQFQDIPQIHLDENSLLNAYSGDYADALSYNRAKMVHIFGEDLSFHSGGYEDLPSMQRFLIEQPPFAAGRYFQYNMKYNYTVPQRIPPWPSTDTVERDQSPDTSTSCYSDYARQNELHSPRMLDQTLYESPYASQKLSYPDPDQTTGGAYTPELTHATSIDPRSIEIEYQSHEEETDPVVEGDHDSKLRFHYEHDQGYTKVEHEQEYLPGGEEQTMGHSLRDAESVQPISQDDDSDSDFDPSGPGKPKRRRRASQSSAGSSTKRSSKRNNRKISTNVTLGSTKVTKTSRKGSHSGVNVAAVSSHAARGTHRPFPCPLAIYGCHSQFVSKNEWKRHVSTQHIKLGFWRCDLCPTTVDTNDPSTIYHNDFNRKDLFTQHLRRMHAAPTHSSSSTARNQGDYPVNEDNLSQHQQRCYQSLRDPPPRSSCLFCEREFEGPASWDERMEHVGRHLEKDRKQFADQIDNRDWQEDEFLQQWLLEEGLIKVDRNGMLKLGDGKPMRGSFDDEDSDEE